jgi:hypothetical protein
MTAPTNITITPNEGVAPFEIRLTGDNMFERPGYYKKETFTVVGDDSPATDWVGQEPTRVDGKIGKAASIDPTKDQAVRRTSVIYTHGDFGKSLWPFYSNEGSTGIFTSFFIKLSDSSYNYPVLNAGFGGATAGNNTFPYNTSNSGMNVYINSEGEINFYIVDTVGNDKMVQTKNGITKNEWHHILCQWSSVESNGITWVAMDSPTIYVDAVLQDCDVVKNDLITSLIDTYSSKGSAIGKGAYVSTSTTAIPSTSYTGYTFSDTAQARGRFLINDVYTGKAALNQDQILQYANLPKVEIIQQ